jgi:hypothetical protein
MASSHTSGRVISLAGAADESGAGAPDGFAMDMVSPF